jgi:Protein of unknwon function (DUF3310)
MRKRTTRPQRKPSAPSSSGAWTLPPQNSKSKIETINHPLHYGGADNPYEAIKVIEAWSLNFNLGNTLKYIARCGLKSPEAVEDLKKARWYLDREIQNREKESEQQS